MGEMADEALDRWLDHLDRWLDHLDWDEHEQEDEGGSDSITCKYCALPGLMWQQTNKGWRLADIHGIIHLCAERPMKPHAQQLKDTLQFPGFDK